MPAHARAATISMEARYDRLMKEGKEKEANEFRLLDPDDTSVTTGVQFYDRTGYLNPCLPSSRHFVDKVMGEIQKMHEEAGLPLTTGILVVMKRKIFIWAPDIPIKQSAGR